MMEFVCIKVKKHCEKRKKSWLPVYSPFQTMFSMAICFWVIKSKDCVLKSLYMIKFHLPKSKDFTATNQFGIKNGMYL